MIQTLSLYRGEGFDPYFNLAVEQHLLETVAQGECILYLWQNEHTVVIGKNQNPWKECKTTLLEQEGGHLARRLSGGGAVYHDLGNLNFTFLMPQEDYALDRQLAVIAGAVRSLGVPVEISGRNDILSEGRKFSGNAFYRNGKQAYHHGTLLVSVDKEKMGRYLSPDKRKLAGKGVDSVRSRVMNLTETNPDITMERLAHALEEAFGQVYGLPVEPLPLARLNREEIDRLYRRNQSWQWNYGQKLPFTCQCDGRFSWGGMEICLQLEHGTIRTAKVYADTMDWQLPGLVEQALTGCRFAPEEMAARIRALEIPQGEDILQLISQA